MSEIARNEANFIGYEYKDITLKRKMESLYVDGYNNFGWILEGTSTALQKVGSVTLKFKRDRKIRNKGELTRLQRQFDATVSEIEALENSKVVGASTIAYIIGVIGTACMAGSVFAISDEKIALCIILAIPAFIGWIIPYLLFSNIHRRKTNRVAPLIDQKHDAIYEICEKANALLMK